GNVIAGNGTGANGAPPLNYFGGVVLDSVTNAIIANNCVGLDATGAAAFPNRDSGVRVMGGSGIQIGGETAGERNVISGNGWAGDAFDNSGIVVDGTDGVTIAGNEIGTNSGGTFALGNRGNGILIHDAEHVRIGVAGPEATPAGGNFIVGNG